MKYKVGDEVKIIVDFDPEDVNIFCDIGSEKIVTIKNIDYELPYVSLEMEEISGYWEIEEVELYRPIKNRFEILDL